MIRICILHTWDAPTTEQSSGCCTARAREFYWENQVSVSHCFATSYPATIMEMWVAVLVQKQSHVMKGEARVQMNNKNQTLEKKSRIHSQEPISCNQTCTNIVTHSARHTTVLQDSPIPLVQGLTSFHFSLADLGFTLCIITQSLLLQQNNKANRSTVKTVPGPLPIRITTVAGQVLSWPNVENIQLQWLH